MGFRFRPGSGGSVAKVGLQKQARLSRDTSAGEDERLLRERFAFSPGLSTGTGVSLPVTGEGDWREEPRQRPEGVQGSRSVAMFFC